MNLDEKLDEILEKYEFGNFLKTPEQNYEEAKEAIKQLIEDEIEDAIWHRTIGDE